MAVPPNQPVLGIERLVGHVIGGRWRLDRFIASGGMSAVYAGQHIRVKTLAAIKILKPELFRDPVAWERFEREATAANEIGHPGIVSVLDAGHDPELDVHYVAMELLQGQELRDRMEHGPVPVDAALRIVDDALDALAAAHAAGFVHRDLKPENLFLVQTADGRERVKILDFGIARQVDPADAAGSPGKKRTSTAAMMGTPAYMPPEQMRSARRATARSDVWAMGVILYELLAGRRPFEGESPIEIMTAVLSQAPPSLPRAVPPDLASLVLRCLDKDPKRRPADASELRSLLLGALAEEVGAGTAVTPRRVAPTLPMADGPPAPSPSETVTPRVPERRAGGRNDIYLGIGLLFFGAVSLTGIYHLPRALEWLPAARSSTTAAPPPPAPTAPTAPVAPTPRCTGVLGAEETAPVLRDAERNVQACYRSRRRALPELAGHTTVRLEVGRLGTVVDAVTEEAVEPELDECVRDALVELRFPPPSGGTCGFVMAEFQLEAATTTSSRASASLPVVRSPSAGVPSGADRGLVRVVWEDLDESGAGIFDARQVMRLVTTRRAPIMRCYESELRDHPDTAGRVRMSMTIQESGSVTTVRGLDNTTGSEPLVRCLVRVVSGFRFTPTPSDGSVTIAFPLVFEAGPLPVAWSGSLPPPTRSEAAPASDASLPETPSTTDVRRVLAGLMPRIRRCAGEQTGTARAIIMVQSDGTVGSVSVGGSPFGGTPAGSCMEGVIAGAAFPRFRQSTFRITYPISIRP